MKQNRKKLFLILGLVVLVAAVTVLIIVLASKKQDKVGSGEPSIPATTSSTAATENTVEITPEQKAKDAYTAYVSQNTAHSGDMFLYATDNCIVAIMNGAVTGSYQSIDEAKAATLGDGADAYTTKEVGQGLFLLGKIVDLYTPAVPESQGVKNAIERAYQLADLQWTPEGGVVPGVVSQGGKFTVISHEAGTTYQGVPYSGTTATDTYLGMNVSLESFLTALKNPNSVLYTENLFSTNAKAASYYGTVCSKFVQSALDIPGSYNSQHVHKIPNVKTIAGAGKYTVDQIKLGDIVVDPDVHTTICTGILYDADGNVAYVEISEAVLPRARRKLWSTEEFYKHFEGYRLCRYTLIDNVPAAPEMPTVEKTYALMTRFGDKYNFTVSEDKGIVDILESGYSKAVILRDGTKITEIALDETTKTFEFDRSVPGYLEMYLEKDDGTRSGSILACVVQSSVAVTDYKQFFTGRMPVTFEGSCGTPVYVQVGSAQSIFCSIRDSQDGQATIVFPADGLSLSKTKIRVAYQNEYGIYLSDWYAIMPETTK